MTDLPIRRGHGREYGRVTWIGWDVVYFQHLKTGRLLLWGKEQQLNDSHSPRNLVKYTSCSLKKEASGSSL